MPTDPMMRSKSNDAGTLFDPTLKRDRSTSEKALDAASNTTAKRYAQILDLLRCRGPLTLFEIAEILGVFDHQISGRITELKASRQIVDTGQVRKKPQTNQDCAVYDLAAPIPAHVMADALGYPEDLTFAGQRHRRELPDLSDTTPGVEYSVRTDLDKPGLRLSRRVRIVRCEYCGHPLKEVGTVTRDGKQIKQFRCGGEGCNQTWEPTIATTPGRPAMIALINHARG